MKCHICDSNVLQSHNYCRRCGNEVLINSNSRGLARYRHNLKCLQTIAELINEEPEEKREEFLKRMNNTK